MTLMEYFMRLPHPLALATLLLLTTTSIIPSHAQALSNEAENEAANSAAPNDIVVTGQITPSQYSLEEANVGGFGPIKITEIPQSVQSLSSDFIRDQGVLSIAQLISNAVPSVSGTLPRTTPFSTAFTRIRGQDALVYRDGLRDVDFADIDTSALVSIASVEVLKGPSGLLFGTGGPGGVINLVTKRPTKQAQATFTTTVGTRGVFIVSGDVSTPLGAGFGLRVTGELERSNSFIRFSEIERDNFAAVLGFDNDGPLRARLRLERQSNRDDGAMNNVGLPAVGTIRTNVNGVFQIDPRVQIDSDAFFGEPALDFQRSSGTIASAVVEYDLTDAIGLELAGRYTRVNFEQNNVQGLGALNPTTFILPRTRLRELDLESNQYNVRGLVRAAFDTGPLAHTLSVGAEYFQQDIVITNLEALRAGIPNIDVRAPTFLTSFPSAREFVFNRDTKDDLVEFFIHDVVRFGEKLTLTAALRYSSSQFDDEEAISAQPATSTTPAVRARAAASRD
jgi:iron complex outermembrane recepter protein